MLEVVGSRYGVKCKAAFVQSVYAVDKSHKVCDVFEPMEQVVILAKSRTQPEQNVATLIAELPKEDKKRDKKADLKLLNAINRVKALASSSDSSSDLETFEKKEDPKPADVVEVLSSSDELESKQDTSKPFTEALMAASRPAEVVESSFSSESLESRK